MIYVEEFLRKYKIEDNNGRVFDPIRKKPVPATPEEFVRQRVIQYLLQEMHVPENKIVVEKALSSFGLAGNSKRIDIGILGEDNILNTIIECKAYGLQFSEAPFLQAIDYVEALKVKNYFVVDGVYFDCYTHDAQNFQFVKLEKIPTYEEMC